MNALMYDGKKSGAEGIVYGALDVLRKRGGPAADPVTMADMLNALDPSSKVRVPCLPVFALTGPVSPVPSF